MKTYTINYTNFNGICHEHGDMKVKAKSEKQALVAFGSTMRLNGKQYTSINKVTY